MIEHLSSILENQESEILQPEKSAGEFVEMFNPSDLSPVKILETVIEEQT